ncbi:multicopper oxidase domain-containing protein [Alicyclobacillus tolerans]|nr:multicopper oxidase domain-containing protein [Alicyclobacillus tolerans]
MHIENDTNFIHPMHLHGTRFQVLSRDRVPVTGSPGYLDTIEVLPGESYDIALKAKNPGLWMFHCRDLHHAAAGMDTLLQYSGITDPYNIKDMSEQPRKRGAKKPPYILRGRRFANMRAMFGAILVV